MSAVGSGENFSECLWLKKPYGAPGCFTSGLHVVGRSRKVMQGGQQSRSLYPPTDTTSSLVMVHELEVQQLFVCADSNHSITGGAGTAIETGTAAFSCCKHKALLLSVMWYSQSSPEQQRSCLTWHSCSKGSFSLATALPAWESKDFPFPSSWAGKVYTQLSITTVF